MKRLLAWLNTGRNRAVTWVLGRIEALTEAVSVRELHVYGGLGLVTWGIWNMHENAAVVVLGVALVYLGLWYRRPTP